MVFPYRIQNLFSVIRPLLILALFVGQIVGGRSCCCFSSEVTRWIGDSICLAGTIGVRALETITSEKNFDAASSSSDVAQNLTGQPAPRRCPKCVGREIALESYNAARTEPVRGKPAFGTVGSCQCQSQGFTAMVQPIESSLELGSSISIPLPSKSESDIAAAGLGHRVSPTGVALGITWQARACIWRF